MIRSFADKETERIWNGERSRKLGAAMLGPLLESLQ